MYSVIQSFNNHTQIHPAEEGGALGGTGAGAFAGPDITEEAGMGEGLLKQQPGKGEV